MTREAPRVLSVGHGARSLAEFQDALVRAGVEKIADVRRYPGSRRHPHFSRGQLQTALSSIGIDYEWWGEELGGRRETVAGSRHIAWRNDSFRGYADFMDSGEFRAALLTLEEESRTGVTAVMCAETLWWKCHRRLIADALTLRKNDVLHILGPGDVQPHKLHPQVRAGEDGWPVYDVGETPTLL